MNEPQDLESPKFFFNDVRLLFELSLPIDGLAISNNIAHVILVHKVQRFSLDEPSAVDTIEIPAQFRNYKKTGHWIDRTGRHFILQFDNCWHLYLHASYLKFKLLSRLNSLKITTILFKVDGADSEKCEILITDIGQSVFVCLLKAHTAPRTENKRDDKQLRQIYKASSDIITACISSADKIIYLLTESEIILWDFPEHLMFSLQQTTPHVVRSYEPIKKYRYFTDSDHYYLLEHQSSFIVTNDFAALLNPAPIKHDLLFRNNIEFVATNHFYIILNDSNSVYAQDKLLSQPPIFVELSPHLKLIGLAPDLTQKTIWAYSKDSIYEIECLNELESVWGGYYALGRFDDALNLLRDMEPSPKVDVYQNLVNVKKGYSLLQLGGFGIDVFQDNECAKLLDMQRQGVLALALLLEPFEKVCLMLLSSRSSASAKEPNSDLLLTYLMERLSMATAEGSFMKTASLTSWILFRLAKAVHDSKSAPGAFADKQLGLLDSQLKIFLTKFCHTLDFHIVVQVLSRMNIDSASIHFALLKKEYAFAINFYIERQEWEEIAKVLSQAYEHDNSLGEELLYKSSKAFIQKVPRLAITTWLGFSSLDTRRLLPAIFTYHEKFCHLPLLENYALHYLSKSIFERNECDPLVTNSYLSLLIRFQDGDQGQSTEALVKALNHLRNKRATNDPLYDPKMILRLALQYGKLRPAILVMVNDFKLYDSAMQLMIRHKHIALAEFVLKSYESGFHNINPNSTRPIEDADEGTQNLRVRLWLSYAKFLIVNLNEKSLNHEGSIYGKSLGEDEADVRSIVHYLLSFSKDVSNKNCPMDVKSILKLLPESVEVSSLKVDILQSLDQYNDHISSLTNEMRELADITLNLRQQIMSSRKDSVLSRVGFLLEAGEPCRLCSKTLLDRNMIVYFNCQHAFHKECIAKYHLKQRAEYKFKELYRRIRQFNLQVDREKLEELFVQQCVLCHDSNLNSIDEDLTSSAKGKGSMDEWAI